MRVGGPLAALLATVSGPALAAAPVPVAKAGGEDLGAPLISWLASLAAPQADAGALAITVQSAAQPSPPPEETPAEAYVREQSSTGTAPSEAPLEEVPGTEPGDIIDGRRRPGVEQRDLPDAVTQDNPGAVRAPPPEAFPTDQIPIPDRWRLIQTLGIVRERWYDPYNQNTYKGDRPICLPTDEEQARRQRLRDEAEARGEPAPYGSAPCATPRFLKLKTDEWFFPVSVISDTIIEPRTFPIPVGVQTTQQPDRNDVFGDNDSLVVAQTVILSASLLKGSTAYKPPDIEYRVALAFQANYVNVNERRVLFVEPSKGTDRFDFSVGVQEAFVDYHFRNVSDRFDFDSIRVGIQPFQFDFRGFLFQDQQLGVRLFGNRDNNRFQYNLVAAWQLEKDTNSGLNDVTEVPRQSYIFHGNVYRQDFPVVGLTSMASITYNMNRERGDREIDDNGFPVRPALLGNLRARNYDVVYVGYGFDGRIGKINLSGQAYGAFGEDRNNIFTSKPANIRSYFVAVEPSYDQDWIRFRGAFLFASGDGKPFNNTQAGFDSIFENPIFAGADTSYWIRQTIPFAGGGRAVAINGRNGILNSLRSSKEEGQSNFVNPGTILVGAGADFDLTQQLRVSVNLNHLWFHKTQVLEALRVEGSIPSDIGYDLSAAIIYRPKSTQNLVFRLSGAVLEKGDGFKDLFDNFDGDKRYLSVLFNAILTY